MESQIPFRSYDEKQRNNDDGRFTFTSTEQKRVEEMLFENYENLVLQPDDFANVSIFRQKHASFLLRYLANVPKSYSSLDASRPWMCYWAVHALTILEVKIPEETINAVITLIKACEHPDGGYGGGPGQYAHLAPTYAAVMCLVSLKNEKALESINKESLFQYLKASKHPIHGGFYMHFGGEIDMRSAYCALAICQIIGLPMDELSDGTAEWVISCQTYEGGFGGEPYTEAHGGYTFCAVAALVLMDRFRLVDFESLLRWGRTNKLVDGCYSFWQGAIYPLIDGEMEREGKDFEKGLFDSRMLEEYTFVGCQSKDGGFRDKPDKG
ncbi:unnamed protein product [Caenorhabditis angaria]|uniref:Protein farnesyltransferase subunit beta n=1 Tax=Caenorhabditis angaria TaxID=860376 RepID=A0A9P1IS84_9PELO|nr:unnamed protein product [Caenorhabditis angaria]